MRCSEHGVEGEGEFTDDHCRSVIEQPIIGQSPNGKNLMMFHVHIKVWFRFPDRHADDNGRTYHSHPISTSDSDEARADALRSIRDNVFRDFEGSIHRHWNDKLWLESTRLRAAPGYKCGVTVHLARNAEDADLNIVIFYQIRERNFRPSCHVGGYSTRGRAEMFLAYPDPCQPSGATSGFETENRVRGESSPFTQNRSAHELGHYFSLPHHCATRTDDNSDTAYCVGRSRDELDYLMAVGNNISPRCGDFFRRRFGQHHMACSGGWAPRLLHP